MKKGSSSYLTIVLLAAVVCAGAIIYFSVCRPSQHELENRKQEAVMRIDDTFRSARSLLFEGKSDEAQALITGLFADRAVLRYAPNELNISAFLYNIDQGNATAAQKFLKDIAATDAAAALPLREQLYSILSANAAECVTWCKELLADPNLSPEPALIYEWLINTAMGAKAPELCENTFKFLLAQPKTEEVAETFTRALGNLCLNGKTAEAMEAIRLLVKNDAQKVSAGYQKLTITVTIYHLIAQGKAEELLAIIPDSAAILPDGEFLPLMRKALPAFKKSNAPELTAFANACVALASTHPKTADYAAGFWLDERLKADPCTIAADLETLRERAVSPVVLADLFTRHFYTYIENPEAVKELCEFGLRLSPMIEDEAVLSYFRSPILDAAFMIKDYPLCFKILDEGIPKQPVEWHAMIRAKIRAHEALDAGDTDTAVASLREFMTYIEQSDEDNFDPALQIVFPKATVFGRNTRRIAEIYQQAGKDEEAAAAREETLKYFQEAVETAIGEKAKAATTEELNLFIFNDSITRADIETAQRALAAVASAASDPANYLPLRQQLYTLLHAPESSPKTCLAWYRDLLSTPRLSPDPDAIYRWMITDSIAANDAELRNETFAFLLKQPNTALVADTFKSLLEELCKTGKATVAAEAMKTLLAQSETKGNTTYAKLAATVGVYANIARGDAAAFLASIPGTAAVLTDAEFQPLVRHALSQLKKAHATRLGASADACVALAATHPKTADLAATFWLDDQIKLKPEALPAALENLRARAISPSVLVDLFSRHFYDTIDKPEIVKQLSEFGLRLGPAIKDPAILSYFRGMLLDAAFSLKDYPLCFKILDEGIPDQDADWHAMIRAKVRSHEAIDAGKADDAAKYLREFMAFIEKGEDESFDPVLQIAFPKATVLGRNARRISELYAQAGKTAEAAEARAQALSYFEQAVEKAASDKAKAATTEELKAFKTAK